ncbi:ABC transporter ATP-binding protein [Desulfitobacterium chlororespirans]|uniref:Iron complex transport system ATP-binding protein n=1 Tax=Desulfitobacterium chlororespirans DSM 11544 TaxID=1121395 RepID=A0A1M7TAY9_9FIRM|nr:ABC transporter ATP-binding protein [Desulfitobacterium chlororespirans]SHN67894.1 iron complex transport system ATP-binding protein [Desulfitobacterium chlororespirans DSM 11544]
MLFELKDGVCGYSAHKPVLRDINFTLTDGEVLCLLGANGVGKSTLFKSMLALIPILGGTLSIDGENILRWSRAKIAQKIGYVPQSTNPPFSYSVMDVILMGRAAHLGMMSSPKKEDEEIAESVVERLGIQYLVNKRYLELSGGEKQLVLIARALTQQPQLLIMDEPTTALDFGNQQLVLNQVHQLSQQGLGIIMSSHFPDHAFLYSHKVLMLKNGGIYAMGAPAEVISEQTLRDLYRVETKIIATGIISNTTGSEIKACISIT